MPIYEFACQDCGAQLELMLPRGQFPETCGTHCHRSPGAEGHGCGRLQKCISRPAAVRNPQAIGHEGPTTKQMSDAGFSVYRKSDEGPGKYRKEAGGFGPDTIQR